MIVSPSVVAVVAVVLTTARLGLVTGIVTVLDRTEPLSVRPSGKVKLYAIVPWLTSSCGEGSEVMITEKATATVAPAAIVPAAIPVAGSACGRGSPLIRTLFGSNVVPAGMVSVTVKAAG
ncbi:hypothetical protein D3C75_1050670 [compost metagenome]